MKAPELKRPTMLDLVLKLKHRGPANLSPVNITWEGDSLFISTASNDRWRPDAPCFQVSEVQIYERHNEQKWPKP
jgi:hypothetical protein